MPDQDLYQVTLRDNLYKVLAAARDSSRARAVPTVETARLWQQQMFADLPVHPPFVGSFRGEQGLEDVEVEVLGSSGVSSERLASQLQAFQAKLHRLVTELDRLVPPGQLPDADQLAAVLDLCAWTHAEWVRLHPFANGNGRTARLWANSLAMRYGLPPFVHLRPRPESDYAESAAKAMHGDWKPTAVCFEQLLVRFLNRSSASAETRQGKRAASNP